MLTELTPFFFGFILSLTLCVIIVILFISISWILSKFKAKEKPKEVITTLFCQVKGCHEIANIKIGYLDNKTTLLRPTIICKKCLKNMLNEHLFIEIVEVF